MSEQREVIVEKACELFLEDGLEGFSMRKLAKRVGVTAPALYRHYESKEAVLHDVVSEAYRRMSQRLYRALEGRTPVERMRLAGEGYLDFALSEPRLFDALFGSPELLGLGDIPDSVEAQGCAIGQFWKDRIRECMDAGMFKKGDPEGVARTLWAHAHGLITLFTRGLLSMDGEVSEEEFRRIYSASSRRLLAGLGTAAWVEAAQAESDNEVVDDAVAASTT